MLICSLLNNCDVKEIDSLFCGVSQYQLRHVFGKNIAFSFLNVNKIALSRIRW